MKKKQTLKFLSVLMVILMFCIPICYQAQALQEKGTAPRALDEGIYYLRNAVTNQYATLDPGSQKVYQSALTKGNTYQMWAIKGIGAVNTYNIYSGGMQFNYRMTQFALNTTTQKADVRLTTGEGDSRYKIAILSRSDGYFSIISMLLDGAASRYLQVGTGNNLVWSLDESTSAAWILERVNYKMGDADMSGYINSSDVTCVQGHITAVKRLSGTQFLLADLDKNNVINTMDVLAIQKIYSNKPLVYINGTQYPEGTTLKCTLKFSCVPPVVGLNGTFTYDPNVVTLDQSTVEFFRMPSPFCNKSNPGIISFNCADFNTFSLNGLAPIMTANFTVNKNLTANSTSMSFVMEELLDANFNQIEGTYTITFTELGF